MQNFAKAACWGIFRWFEILKICTIKKISYRCDIYPSPRPARSKCFWKYFAFDYYYLAATATIVLFFSQSLTQISGGYGTATLEVWLNEGKGILQYVVPKIKSANCCNEFINLNNFIYLEWTWLWDLRRLLPSPSG